MAIQISITIPGDMQTEGSSVYRLKSIIDWQYRDDEEKPSTAQEYQSAAESILKEALRAYVVHLEKQKARQEANINEQFSTQI